MDVLYALFGKGKDLNTLQMCARAASIFFIALVFIRLSGRRSFGMRSPFDNVTVILLGAILSRTIVGASAFIPTISASLVIVLLHRLIAWLSLKIPWLSRITKGNKVVLFKDGKFNYKNMQKVMVSEAELREAVRLKSQQAQIDLVQVAYMERCGEISIILKQTGS